MHIACEREATAVFREPSRGENQEFQKKLMVHCLSIFASHFWAMELCLEFDTLLPWIISYSW